MKTFLVECWCYAPYKRQKSYRITASGVHTAIARAAKQFKKEEIKRNKIGAEGLNIKAILLLSKPL